MDTRPRAYVIPADNSWGTVRLMFARLLNLNYEIDQWVNMGTGETWLVIKG